MMDLLEDKVTHSIIINSWLSESLCQNKENLKTQNQTRELSILSHLQLVNTGSYSLQE